MTTAPITGIGGSTVTMMPGWRVTLNNELWRTWNTMAAEMEAIAKRLVPSPERGSPYATGELQATISGRTHREGTAGDGTIVLELTAGTDHAMFVEYGTGARGRGSGGETPPGYTHGKSRGMEAQPYLRPAQEDVMRRWFGASGGSAI